MAEVGVKHLSQGVLWKEAAWQHCEEEVAPAASPETCPDLEGAAWAPNGAGGSSLFHIG